MGDGERREIRKEDRVREFDKEMRLPRFILNPSVRPWILLWQRERRANARLRAELREWQGKFLEKVKTRQLFTPDLKLIDMVDILPIGLMAKVAYLNHYV